MTCKIPTILLHLTCHQTSDDMSHTRRRAIMPATLSASWNSDIISTHTGTIICRFTTDTDGTLFTDSTNSLRCEIRQTSLQFSVAIDDEAPIALDMEDALGLTTGTPHTVHFTFGDFGTRVYLDGYQCFACASNLSPTRIANTGTIIAGEASDSLEILEYAISSEQIGALCSHSPTNDFLCLRFTRAAGSRQGNHVPRRHHICTVQGSRAAPVWHNPRGAPT